MGALGATPVLGDLHQLDAAGLATLLAGSALPELVERPMVNRTIVELTEGDAPVREALQELAP